jgi:hypothetical protein
LPAEILPTVHLETNKKAVGQQTGEGGDSAVDPATSDSGQGTTMEQEEKEKGVVKLAIYSIYWRAVGVCLSPLILLSLLLMQGMCALYFSHVLWLSNES